ncbi:MAG: DUF692 domain-containing protein [Candidatus Tectomicrobia bacterium]|uniref:DUF692 domain-containing protein n=1 Tax=Tectimicrobiota bacterium TaxID=2528274 RepID=A0A938B0T2_UNCTE|nr:DUF692 domain-containing protein [Candidatus Tectomicrobia bacterium]
MESADRPSAAWIGPGLSYRRRYHQELLNLRAEEQTTAYGQLVLEILPDHFFANPAALEALAERYCLVFHDVGLSMATVGWDDARQHRLQCIQRLVKLARPVLFSDHLAMTYAPAGLDSGHLVPVWYTAEALDVVAEHVRRCQDILEIPCALENIAWPFLLPAPMSEPEFCAHLVQRTGCGLLLDVANLLCNLRNFPDLTAGWLQHYPLHAVQQIHLAGGVCQEGWWVDSHSTPVEAASLELFPALQACAAVKTIVIERDRHLPPLTALLAEAQHAAQYWQQVCHGALR